jgi:ketosteroid isomerase-like protein
VPTGAKAAARIDPAAAAAVAKLTHGLIDQQSWGDELAGQSDAVVVGPTAGDISRGKKAIKKLWSARLKANVREAVSGDVSSAVTPDGELAWASVAVTRVADGEPPLPLRLFAVFEKDAAAWKLIALHEAVAIDEPGSGTPFKKIVPPAPEPAKATAADVKPADSADAKPKRKKKPKPASDD